MNIIARKTSEFLSLRRESALCAFALLGLSHSSSYMVVEQLWYHWSPLAALISGLPVASNRT
jgi:DMSO/TMAO reductase YedYZ heme-binding membrane subunit